MIQPSSPPLPLPPRAPCANADTAMPASALPAHANTALQSPYPATAHRTPSIAYGARRTRRRRRLLGTSDDDMDPLGFLVNLFDVALVFALALMIALVSNLKLADLLTSRDFTIVKNPGAADMEIITRQDGNVSRYVADESATAQGMGGQRIGTAYRLENGEIVYVPDQAQSTP